MARPLTSALARVRPRHLADPDDQLECPHCHSLSIGDRKLQSNGTRWRVSCGGCGRDTTGATKLALLKKLRRAG